MEEKLSALAEQLGRHLTRHQQSLATAESCTGGWLAKIITDIPGSSAWFDRGFISYCNQAKQQMLGVSAATLAQYGAVSTETAQEMASGALSRSNADIAVAITGIAGPDGGSKEKPVGMVFIAWANSSGEIRAVKKQFFGTREQIRAQAVETALAGAMEIVGR